MSFRVANWGRPNHLSCYLSEGDKRDSKQSLQALTLPRSQHLRLGVGGITVGLLLGGDLRKTLVGTPLEAVGGMVTSRPGPQKPV